MEPDEKAPTRVNCEVDGCEDCLPVTRASTPSGEPGDYACVHFPSGWSAAWVIYDGPDPDKRRKRLVVLCPRHAPPLGVDRGR